MRSGTLRADSSDANHDGQFVLDLPRERPAFGHPGIEPRWTHGNKDGAGTSYSTSSCIWFTLWNGVVTEIFYPTIDCPQVRDLQYLITDGKRLFHEEKRHLISHTGQPWSHTLGYRITNVDPEGRYTIHKDVITDPHLPCVIQHTRVTGDPELLSTLRLYAICAPHLDVGGWHNNGYIFSMAGRRLLLAEKNGVWLAIGATVPFLKGSCGYVGESDGWQDLSRHFQLTWNFDHAMDGNIALTGELDLTESREFTLVAAFGNTLHRAATTLLQSLELSFEDQRNRFITQWRRAHHEKISLEHVSHDSGRLYRQSVSLLLAHEDKVYPGALVASLSIPWGEMKTDDSEYGGYHFVWPRDLVSSAMALLASGEIQTAQRFLIYLAVSQESDGGFPKNFHLVGTPQWRGIQLDEVAFPILLAWRLHTMNTLREFDPYPMVASAVRYLILHGPVTQEERWEQASGFSPATLATNIAALIAAACWMRERGDEVTAEFVENYADFLECHVEAWTVTTMGSLVEGIPQHYIRIHPADIDDPCPQEDPNQGHLVIPHRHPDSQHVFPARDIIDPSFLELVRYGIRAPDDAIVRASLDVVDALLKTETPHGPVWRRYNHDGHGQREDGSSWDGWGTGRSWTLLTAERGLYELAAGRDGAPYIRAMEGLASATGLLPEQVWDAPDLPDQHMRLGGATGSAQPLMWAHADYIRLLRSVSDGQVFDYLPEVGERYRGPDRCRPMEIWKLNRRVRRVQFGSTLRVQLPRRFRLRWSDDHWNSLNDTTSTFTSLELFYVDSPIVRHHKAIHFSLYWLDSQTWGDDTHCVTVVGA